MHTPELFDMLARVVFEVSHHQIQLSDLNSPIAEMDIDSVELMEIFGMLEEEVGVCFPEDRIAEVTTFEELLALLKSLNSAVSTGVNGVPA